MRSSEATTPSRGGVLFLVGRGGGGHVASARALQVCARQQGVTWAEDIELIDIGYLIESFLPGRRGKPRTSGFDGDELYNWLMKKGLYRLAALCGPLALLGASICHGCIMQGFEKFWQTREPRLVCPFIPFFNGYFRQSLLRAGSRATLFTVCTDFETNRAHRWIPKYDSQWSTRHIIVAGTSDLRRQCNELGYPQANVLQTSGMVLHPAFTSSPGVVAAAPNRALVFFGGFAPHAVEGLVRSLRSSHPELELIVLCGGNDKLRATLEASGLCAKVEGVLTPEVIADYMRQCCFVIGKPGPGAVSEAIACRRPIVTQRKSVMAQELCVLRWVEENNLGIVVDNLKKLPSDVVTRAKACEVAVERLPENRAVFEVLEACEQRILPLRDVSFGSSSGAGSPGMASPAGSDDGTLSRGLLEKV